MNTLWVVIAAYNEAGYIRSTLEALASQQERDFTVVVVDNGSTDATADIVRDFGFPGLHVITESQKGTGAAADTGMRYAIEHGATHLARVDADCLPDPNWITAIRQSFADGLELVAGAILPRREPEAGSALRYAWLVTCLVCIAVFYSIRNDRRKDHDYLGPYVMISGSNMAITADLYERCGGFERISIEDGHEDDELLSAVRQITKAYARSPKMRVRISLRRFHAWGLRRTTQWYARTGKAEGAWGVVDIR